MGSSSCSSSSASNPCWFRAVAACASAKNLALAANRRLPEGNLERLALPDDGRPSGYSDAGMLTKAESLYTTSKLEEEQFLSGGGTHGECMGILKKW